MKILLLLTTVFVMCYQKPIKEDMEDRKFWLDLGKEQLKKAVKEYSYRARGRAKSVIIFIGSGMGPSTVSATRIYKALKAKASVIDPLYFEELPYTGVARTYSVDQQVPDTAAAATALLTGVKTKSHLIGFDGRIKGKRCNFRDYDDSKLTSIANWALKKHKSVGLVTNTRITYTTPAAMYANVPNRSWECHVPDDFKFCFKDIGTQLIRSIPGSKFRVILGGGQDYLGVTKTRDCSRNEGLVDIWLLDKKKYGAAFVQNTKELKEVNPNKISYLLGLFGNGDMSYELNRDNSDSGQPSLTQMTEKALQMLKKNRKGFVLLVTGGLIDEAHHENWVKLALEETIEFDRAVKYALDNTEVRRTLIIVTADHSQGLSIYGYPDLRSDILGPSGNAKWDILFYGTGPGGMIVENDTRREFFRKHDSVWRRAYAAFYSERGVHTGEDVNVYARGPGAPLLIGSYEQNYIAHVIAYAADISSGAINSVRYFSVTFVVSFVLSITSGRSCLSSEKL